MSALPPRAIKSCADAAAGAVCGTSGCTRAIFVLQSWATKKQQSCSSTALRAGSRTCLNPWKMSCQLRCCAPQLLSTSACPDEATCVPVTPWHCRSVLSAAGFPAQSACSWLPGYFKTVLKALTATSVNPGLLPRAFLHNSDSHSSCDSLTLTQTLLLHRLHQPGPIQRLGAALIPAEWQPGSKTLLLRLCWRCLLIRRSPEQALPALLDIRCGMGRPDLGTATRRPLPIPRGVLWEMGLWGQRCSAAKSRRCHLGSVMTPHLLKPGTASSPHTPHCDSAG